MHLSAIAADLLSVRIAASFDNAHASVQESVVVLILTDDEWRIPAFTSIGVVDDGSERERMPEGFLGTEAMQQFSLTV